MKKVGVLVIVFLLLFIPISSAKTLHPISKETIKIEQVTTEEVDTEPEGKRSVASDTYYYYGTGLIAKEENNEIKYIHKDNLGSTRAVTDLSGEVLEESTYLPYGENLDSSRETFTFTGKELDSSGLQYFGARYYDPSLGRFITLDPIKDGVNHYVYVSNNPLKYIDPTGLIELRSVGECILPSEPLRAMYSVTMDKEYERSSPGGLSVSQNYMEGSWLDFLPFFHSEKEQFFNIMKEKTTYSKTEIEDFYNILTTPGNIVLEEDSYGSYLFHERIHHVITFMLPEEDVSTLIDAQETFIWITANGGTLEEELEHYLTEHTATFTFFSILTGSWQELYAYMGQFEEYPGSQYTFSMGSGMDKEVPEFFEYLLPEAYEIYQDVLQQTRELDPGYQK